MTEQLVYFQVLCSSGSMTAVQDSEDTLESVRSPDLEHYYDTVLLLTDKFRVSGKLPAIGML